MLHKVIPDLHKKYIKRTLKEALVQGIRVFLCHLTATVSKQGIKVGDNKTRGKVYISTRTIKHTYDKRPAVEYDSLIENLHTIVKYPDYIYKNKPVKRGDFCFIKSLSNELYFCCVEQHSRENTDEFSVVTFYKVPKEKYLKNYELLWDWKDDKTLHRSAFDAGDQPTNTPQ